MKRKQRSNNAFQSVKSISDNNLIIKIFTVAFQFYCTQSHFPDLFIPKIVSIESSATLFFE